jgi:hypothetical protein
VKDSGQAIQEVLAQQGYLKNPAKRMKRWHCLSLPTNSSGPHLKRWAGDQRRTSIPAAGAEEYVRRGELSLADVLTAVSGEIEEEFGEGKGISFAMLSLHVSFIHLD